MGIAALAGACDDDVPTAPSDPTATNASRTAPIAGRKPTKSGAYSNIYRFDYVGPGACSKCHQEQYDLWRNHPHAHMNASARGQTVAGDFSGAALSYGGGRVVFEQIGGNYTMAISYRGKPVRRYSVTRTVGSRFVQMYIGVQVEGPEPAGHRVYSEEGKLPFAWWIDRKMWFPQTYDEEKKEPEYGDDGELTPKYRYHEMRRVGAWSRNCALCHNTYPYALKFAPVAQGKLFGFDDVSLDAPSEQNALHDWDLVTLGISCESCHFGGAEHALYGRPAEFVPSGDGFRLKGRDALAVNARQNPAVINKICAQCHSARTQGPKYPNGAASWNSAEAKDLAAGACASKIRCTDCHDPHRAGPREARVADNPEHVAACKGCHEAIDDGHMRHESTTCLDCHMPRMVHGLGGMIRSHRISSPSDGRMLQDWPNACNMCHLDKSLRWTLDELAKGWRGGERIDGVEATDLAAGPRWLADDTAMVRQIAADAYGRSPLDGSAERKAALERVIAVLDDPSPPNRMFGIIAVEAITGRAITVDDYQPWASPEARKAQIDNIKKASR